MQIATALLKLDNFTTLNIHEMTPAEAACLIAAHQPNAGTMPLSEVKIIGERKVKHADERARLLGKYLNLRRSKELKSIVEELYPSPFAKLQETFAEIGLPAEVDKAPSPTIKQALHRIDNHFGQMSDQPEGFQAAVAAAV